MEVEVMPDGFSPRRRGRKPTYDIAEVLAGLTANPGRWVKFTLTTANAKSAQRQLSRMNFDVSAEAMDENLVVLYVRQGGQQ